MDSKRGASIMSVLLYAQGLLIVAAVAAVMLRMPAGTDHHTLPANPVVASIAAGTVAQ